MLRAIGSLIAVVLILGGSYLASKYIGRGMSKSSSALYMRLLDQITLGQDRHIAIIQVGGKYLLVGVTAGQIQVLAELHDDDLIQISPEDTEGKTNVPDFKMIMDKLSDLGKKGGRY